jgi:hypothetical protein
MDNTKAQDKVRTKHRKMPYKAKDPTQKTKQISNTHPPEHQPMNSRKVFVCNYFYDKRESFSEINNNISMALLNHHSEHHINKYETYIKIGINS